MSEREEPLSAVELEATLWALRQVPLEVIRLAGVAERFGDGVRHGALVTATAKLQRQLSTRFAHPEAPSTSTPRSPARLLATDREPGAVADVVVLEPGPDQYESREGYRDVGVADKVPTTSRSRGEFDEDWRLFVQAELREFVAYGERALALADRTNLVFLWQDESKAIVGTVFLGARLVEHQVLSALSAPEAYRARWRYERTEELREGE